MEVFYMKNVIAYRLNMSKAAGMFLKRENFSENERFSGCVILEDEDRATKIHDKLSGYPNVDVTLVTQNVETIVATTKPDVTKVTVQDIEQRFLDMETPDIKTLDYSNKFLKAIKSDKKRPTVKKLLWILAQLTEGV